VFWFVINGSGCYSFYSFLYNSYVFCYSFYSYWGWFVARAFGGLGVTTGLAADRAALSGVVAGQQFFETDTKLLWYFDGAVWQRVHPAGMVVQSVYVRSDGIPTYTVNTSGTAISALNITIVPRYATSTILLLWMLNGEIGGSGAAVYNSVFRVFKDNSVMTNPAAYNTSYGNLSYNGVAFTDSYDNDYSTTGINNCIFFADTNLGSTASRTYSPAIIKSAASDPDATYYLNRTAATPNPGVEVVISTGVAMEIIV
jgi:hypothetical protein